MSEKERGKIDIKEEDAPGNEVPEKETGSEDQGAQEAAAEEASGPAVNDDAKKKKRGKKKKPGLKEEIEALKEDNRRLKDQMLRRLAEFDNYRKRSERDKIRIIETAEEDIIRQLLPVLDDFERSLRQEQGNGSEDSFREGVGLIYSKMKKVLEEKGLTPMKTDGEEFDPHKHDAMMQLETDEVPEGHIIQTFEKGYVFRDKVIRHAKVSVSK